MDKMATSKSWVRLGKDEYYIKIREDVIKAIKKEYVDFPRIFHDKEGNGTSSDLVIDEIAYMAIKKFIEKKECSKGTKRGIQKKECLMYSKGKCNSDYRKNLPCNLKKCPYKLGGSFAMAVNDMKNVRKGGEV